MLEPFNESNMLLSGIAISVIPVKVTSQISKTALYDLKDLTAPELIALISFMITVL